jgi:hypothetical protein
MKGFNWWLPLFWALIALFMIDVVCDGPKLGSRKVVRERLAQLLCPVTGARLLHVSGSCFVRRWAGSRTIQAFFKGTMWSMSTSSATCQVSPSYGLNQSPATARHLPSRTTFLPSLLRTNSLERLSKSITARGKDGGVDIPRVASLRDVGPVRELLARVPRHGIGGSDYQAVQLGYCYGVGGNARLPRPS